MKIHAGAVEAGRVADLIAVDCRFECAAGENGHERDDSVIASLSNQLRFQNLLCDILELTLDSGVAAFPVMDAATHVAFSCSRDSVTDVSAADLLFVFVV